MLKRTFLYFLLSCMYLMVAWRSSTLSCRQRGRTETAFNLNVSKYPAGLYIQTIQDINSTQLQLTIVFFINESAI